MSDNNVRYWYLLTLTSVELLISAFLSLEAALPKPFVFYWNIVLNTGLILMYIFLMLLILFDRFLEIHLHLRYLIYCTAERTKMAILACAFLSIIASIISIMFLEKNYEVIFGFYLVLFWPATGFVFLVCAVVVYSYIYIKIRILRRTRPTTGPFSVATGKRLGRGRFDKKLMMSGLFCTEFRVVLGLSGAFPVRVHFP